MPTLDPLTLLVFYCSLHFLGDFAFQSAWMAVKKVPSNYDPHQDDAGPWEVLLYHCLTYTSVFGAAAVILSALGHRFNPLAIPIIFAAHFIVDALKARKILIKSIWIDQLLHLLTLIPLVLCGWL